MEPSIRLFELNEFLRRTVALNFPTLLWVKAEIAQLQESRGHFYLTLVEKQSEEELILAQSDAIIWQRDYRRMRRKIGVRLNRILQEGMEVLVQVKVEFHERYGLSLGIQDIDGDFTLGQVALRRQQTIERLEKADLLEQNKQLDLPPVLQNLAVISALQAAGYQDYQQQLTDNAYGYRFRSQLFTAAMQGQRTAPEIIQQLKTIAKAPQQYDAVLILRGGGAKIDLMAFDEWELAKAAANCPLPLLVGIGHDVDETVLDMVAHHSLKTPTAVADFILHHNTLFESQLLTLGQQVQRWSGFQLRQSETALQQLEQVLELESKNSLKQADQLLNFIEQTLPLAVQQNLKAARQKLELLTQNIELRSPEECLRRGYSITLLEGKAIDAQTKLKPGDVLETHLDQRQIISEVRKVSSNEKK